MHVYNVYFMHMHVYYIHVQSKRQQMKYHQGGRRETLNNNKVRFNVESKFTYIVCMHILHVLGTMLYMRVRYCKCFIYVHMQLRNGQERGLKLWLGNH